MTTKHSLRVRSRVGILIALGVVSIHVISCISSSSSGGGMSRGDAAVHSGAQCPIACSNQAADCADASALPSTATCLSSCTTEAARADSRSCGGQWDDFIGCCADANGTANCSLSSLPQLNGVNGCSASCRALLSDYNRCVAHGTGGNPMSGSDSGSGTGSDSGTHNADAGSMPSGPDAGMTHGAPDAGNLPLPSMIQIQGYVHNTVGGTGAPVAGATVKVAGVTLATTDASGLFSLSADTTPTGVTLQFEAPEHAPQIVRVPVKPGMMTYSVPVVMQRIQAIALQPGDMMASIDVGNSGTMSTVSFNQPMAQQGTLEFASFSPDNGPGDLRFVDAPTDEGLQSAGMIWFKLKDSQGNQIPMPGANIQIPVDSPTVAGAGEWQGYVMNPNDGQWSDPVAPVSTLDNVQTYTLPDFGYWNADRAFKTACVKGKIAPASVAACGGARVQATGPDGISSFDSIGADGGFCVTGAQTWSSDLRVGAFTQSVTMPANAGNCSAPQTCVDIGEVQIPADQCDLMSLVPPPGEAGKPCTAAEQCTPGNDCFGGYCVGAGVLRVSLSFFVNSDFDLHLTTPNLNQIYFGNETADGGTLDVDQCVGNGCDSSEHVENIVFTSALPGSYDIWVVNYSGNLAGAFTLNVSGDVTQTFTGSLPAVAGAESMHFQFVVGAAL